MAKVQPWWFCPFEMLRDLEWTVLLHVVFRWNFQQGRFAIEH
jgi:hypothetical protein